MCITQGELGHEGVPVTGSADAQRDRQLRPRAAGTALAARDA
jgi:hypothetical protein